MTELQDIGMMCLVEYLDALLAAPTDEARSEIVARRQAETAHLPKEWPTMPTFERGRGASLCALRPRHLLMVEEYGFRRDYDRDALQTYFLDNWHELFGPLRRSRALGVPSDQLRKEIIVSSDNCAHRRPAPGVRKQTRWVAEIPSHRKSNLNLPWVLVRPGSIGWMGRPDTTAYPVAFLTVRSYNPTARRTSYSIFRA